MYADDELDIQVWPLYIGGRFHGAKVKPYRADLWSIQIMVPLEGSSFNKEDSPWDLPPERQIQTYSKIELFPSDEYRYYAWIWNRCPDPFAAWSESLVWVDLQIPEVTDKEVKVEYDPWALNMNSTPITEEQMQKMYERLRDFG